MQPAAFDEENRVLDPPDGFHPDQVQPLSVYKGKNHLGVPVIVSCWTLSKEELDLILQTRRVWVSVMGERMPPILPSIESPFLHIEVGNESSSEETNLERDS